jgi:N-acetylmuramoyl-L-alanine amidase
MPAAVKISELLLSSDKKRLVGCAYDEAGSFGRKLRDVPFLVMHYTAGRGFASTVAHFKSAANKVSAHLVVGRKGELVQMVPFDRPAWHAGAESTWTYSDPSRPSHEFSQPVILKGMNFHTIGIEFDNYGPLRRLANKKIVTWFGREVPLSEVGEVDPTARGSFGVQYWHAYSSLQIALAERLAIVLVRGFGMRDILGHSDVSPSRKTDPGPLFPMRHLRSLVFGRADEEEPTT